MTRFGFELEFESGALPLVQWLYEHHDDLIGVSEIHGYHCDCDECMDFPLRANRDSSCDGELISTVLTRMDDEVRALFLAIQNGAIEVDAEPGMSAGMHVHIDPARSGQVQWDAFIEFLRWEPFLTELASGRWNSLRANNTSPGVIANIFLDDMPSEMWGERLPWLTIPRTLYDSNTSSYVENPGYRRPRLMSLTQRLDFIRFELPEGDRQDAASQLFTNHYNADRHSHLSLRTRFDTWEFRLFNSTRSAWRMELWCQIARAFASQDFVSDLASKHLPRWGEQDSNEHFLAALCRFDDRAAELAERQINYRNRTDFGNLPALTNS